MRASLFLVISVLGLASCASTPTFQENASEGFTIQDSKNPARFVVELHLPTANDGFRSNYVMRAIGETCAKREFPYFNIGAIDANRYEGYCYKTSANRSLGLSLTVPKKDGERFVVENLNGKTNTKVQVGDAVLKVNSLAITSMSVLKNEVFDSVEAKKNFVKLEIERAGQVQSVEEPIADVANASPGPEELQGLRALFR